MSYRERQRAKIARAADTLRSLRDQMVHISIDFTGEGQEEWRELDALAAQIGRALTSHYEHLNQPEEDLL